MRKRHVAPLEGEARAAPISTTLEGALHDSQVFQARPSSGTAGRSGTDTSIGSGTHSMGSSVGPNDSQSFRSLDKSNRGFLQRNDVTGISGFSFDQADSNHDGRISQDEYAQWQAHNGRAGGAMGQGGTTGTNPMSNGTTK